ncbi:head-tail connector protein [Aurantiacibacter gangjinensis]|uniref:Uncharacterized protein n=1 Tax=Aurantiacibacter gangjinensis TaxID=502682 RepID=A0A0G9MNR8_9SPHN|nr:phage head-tail connector protein [Aurantiacibacter gangjinensis]APE27659.1 Gene Transfer Agent (GTA) ORFG06 [Aurantiacibacter gangjinensis]KLE32229.1 hypothetical protein AAW01_09145 [Aurantiacibacter gangjinensis]
MRRAIVVPPVLAADALDELKSWLAITTTRDDESLGDLLRAALEACEGFTGTMPLETGCEEVLTASYEWQALSASPIIAITGVEAVALDGTRSALPVEAYTIDITAGGCGRVRLTRTCPSSRIAVRFDAGLSASWIGLPDGMRHGVIRLAAHYYRERDAGDRPATPPASVSALWRPWRRMRLA